MAVLMVGLALGVIFLPVERWPFGRAIPWLLGWTELAIPVLASIFGASMDIIDAITFVIGGIDEARAVGRDDVVDGYGHRHINQFAVLIKERVSQPYCFSAGKVFSLVMEDPLGLRRKFV